MVFPLLITDLLKIKGTRPGVTRASLIWLNHRPGSGCQDRHRANFWRPVERPVETQQGGVDFQQSRREILHQTQMKFVPFYKLFCQLMRTFVLILATFKA